MLNLIKWNSENVLDRIIKENDLDIEREYKIIQTTSTNHAQNNYGLPICIKMILNECVSFDQRIACFRLAVNLKRIDFPIEITIGALMSWRLKNKPKNDKRTITPDEIVEQVKCAYSKDYKGYRCEEAIIKNFCDLNCKLLKYAKRDR